MLSAGVGIADRPRAARLGAHRDRSPIVVSLPVRGVWNTPSTPGSRIPSHGTDLLGERFAYDFIQVDRARLGHPAYRGGLARYLMCGLPVQQYYCWDQQVHAPCDGTVVRVEDGCDDWMQTGIIGDAVRAWRCAHEFDPARDDPRLVAGNFVIIRLRPKTYAALCHLRRGSIRVRRGQAVRRGSVIGRVGNSGNTFGPHLHFQLMDSDDLAIAQGLPCAFDRYEELRDGSWHPVRAGIPTARDLISSVPSPLDQ